LAIHLERLGARPRLWGRDPALMEEIRQAQENRRYLPGIAVPPGALATADAEEALAGAEIALVAVPSHYVEAVVERTKGSIDSRVPVVSATKGLEPKFGRRMSVLLGDLLPGQPLAVLSGPSFAREVAMGRPTALVIAASDDRLAVAMQHALATPVFRLYTNRDVIGVEIAAALKNVMAIATGLCDGLGLGENARAALVTRGLAEIVRLGVALGARPATFLGLAGLGDLVLTCTGSLSRNRALGLEIARGRALHEVEAGTFTIAEGVRTVSSALALAQAAGITMPICREVGAVLFEGKAVGEALRSLLSREPRPEEEEEEGSRDQ
jgi:glycerol-3-phosphate dehydrogenase (NAD(P)+)